MAEPAEQHEPEPQEEAGPGEGRRDRRWRLLLGEPAEEALTPGLTADEQQMDRALAALYDADDPGEDGRTRRRGGLGASAPSVARWLGDIRTYFPTSVVQVLQRDAIERLDLASLLLEPELLDSVQPDVHLAATLVSLNRVMPETTRRTARVVVGRVVAEIERRIAQPTRSAVNGAVNRAARTSRPRPRDIDWNATIAANLKHYLPEHRTVVPERLVGHARATPAVSRDVVVAIDQSGSMAESVVFGAVFGAVLASIRSLRTSLVVFDTEVVDLTPHLDDPVDVLFGCQLGGGTDINRGLAYAAGLVRQPENTLLVLDHGPLRGRRRRAAAAPGRLAGAVRRDRRGAPRAQRRRRSRVRPRPRGRAGGARRPGLRLHAGRVPGHARRRAAARGRRRLGRRPAGVAPVRARGVVTGGRAALRSWW